MAALQAKAAGFEALDQMRHLFFGEGTLTIEGNVWTFPWETTEKDVTTYFRVVNTWTTPDHIDFRQEYSTDKTHWTLMAKGQDDRVGKN